LQEGDVDMHARDIALGLGFAVVGGAVGWAYFSILRRSVESRVGSSPGGRFVLMALARVAIFGACLAPAFWLGTATVIGYMAGFVVARMVMVFQVRREIAEMGRADDEPPAEQ
jgi:cytochrome c oxidase assembly factor CtaG